MGEWSSASVGDFFDLVNGYAFKSSDFVEKGIPVIKIKNVKAGEFNEHEFSFVSPSFLQVRTDKIARPDDLLISMSGNRHDGSPETWVGKVAHFRKSATYLINQRVGALRLKPGAIMDIRFAGFLLASYPYQELFISIATSSGGQANLSPNQILSAPIRYPDLETQRLIGETLGAIDDKIDINRHMNETLEAMTRTIYKDWFIDFVPTRAKMKGYAPYIASNIWELFPDQLHEEGTPEGWRLGKLGELAESPRTGVDPSEVAPETPYIGLEHMPRRSIALSEWEGAGKVTSSKSAFRRGDFLFGKLRPYFHKVGVAPLDGICSTDIVVVRSNDNVWRSFTIACISSDDFVDYTDRTSTGTKMPRTSWNIMARYEVTLPSVQLAEAFDSLCWPMIEQIESNINECLILAQTRDLLLPKLMSGEISVKDDARQFEELA